MRVSLPRQKRIIIPSPNVLCSVFYILMWFPFKACPLFLSLSLPLVSLSPSLHTLCLHPSLFPFLYYECTFYRHFPLSLSSMLLPIYFYNSSSLCLLYSILITCISSNYLSLCLLYLLSLSANSPSFLYSLFYCKSLHLNAIRTSELSLSLSLCFEFKVP